MPNQCNVPWKHLTDDLLGPLPNGDDLLVGVDFCSRFFEVNILKSISSKDILLDVKYQFYRRAFRGALGDSGSLCPVFKQCFWLSYLKSYALRNQDIPMSLALDST